MLKWIKENRKPLVYALLLSVVFCLPLFTNSIYNGYDLRFHLNRIVGIADAFRDGQILPKIYPYTNNGYGYASPLFYCDLFLYPFAIVYMLGCPLIIAYKLMIIFYTIIGNVFCFVLVKNICNNPKIIYGTLTLYALGNYRLIDCFSRAAFGEFLALSFVPLVLLAFYKVLYAKEEKYIILAIGFTCLLMSHNLTFALYCLLYLLLMVAFIIKNNKDFDAIKKMIITTMKAAVIAILLCIWYMFPMLEQMFDQTLWISELGKMYSLSNNYIEITSFIKPLLELDIKSSMTVAMVNAIGYPLLLIFILQLINKKDYWTKAISVIVIVLLLIATGIIPINQYITIFNTLQFSFRWYILIYPLMVILAIVYLSKTNKQIIVILLLFTFINTIYYHYQIVINDEQISNNISTEDLFDFNNILYKDYNEKQISGGEYLPVTLYNDYLEETTFIKRVNNDRKYEDVVYEYNRYFTNIDFEYTSSGDELLMMPLTYYKGYDAYAIKDGIKYNLDVINVDTYAKVGICTLEGNAQYHVEYCGTMLQHLSLGISVITLLGLFVYSLINWRKKYEEKNIVCE